MPKISRQMAGTYVADFDFTGGGDLAATMNMYYNHEKDVLESFPGFRKLIKLDAPIHGIYHLDELAETYLVHAGDALYRCRFINQYKDTLSNLKLCNMANSKSFAYRNSGKIYIIDGEDITVVDADENVEKFSENPDIAYVPTTYINGEEAEQVNIFSNLFKEETRGITSADFAFGSHELIYKIKSEKDGTCSVCGANRIGSGRADIPSRKMINGRFYKVVEIADNAFMNNTNIKTVVMNSSIKRVGKNAFSGCNALLCVVMPNGIEEIDSRAFMGCSSLESVYLGTTCKNIYYNAFDNCISINHVFVSGNQEEIADCEGFGIMLNYAVFYNYKYTNFYIGIPLFTPAKSISKVLINGTSANYSYSLGKGIIKLSCEEYGNLEGATVVISGEIDRTKVLNSNRKTPISLLVSDAKEVILSATGAEMLDGRAILYGSPYAKSIALTSSKPLTGDTDLLYFGELDYFAVGAAEYEISDIKTMAKYIIISKRNEMGGSIFVYTPKGAADAAFGRGYEMLYKRIELGIKSDLAIYHWMAHFVTNDGVYRMKLSSTAPTIEKISGRKIFDGVHTCPALNELAKEYYGESGDLSNTEIIIGTFQDFLIIIKGGTMLLCDSHLIRKTSEGNSYAYFTMTDIGTYTGETNKYCFAESAPSGFYIHPDAGKVCNEVVYSVGGADGELIYYVSIGNRRYAVIPTEEYSGGTISTIKLILPCEKTLIFATNAGHICAFNTDKPGVPPKRIYEADDFDAEEYNKGFGETIHPDFYAHDKRSVLYAVATEVCDGNAPYMEKRGIRDSFTVRLERRSAEPIYLANVPDSDICGTFDIPIGDFDFSDLNFALISMNEKISETISILDSREKWVNKQIIIYTNGIKSPFAIRGLNFGFRIASKIKKN